MAIIVPIQFLKLEFLQPGAARPGPRPTVNVVELFISLTFTWAERSLHLA
jgi:hypothetical protein